jgi:hypothetical protein
MSSPAATAVAVIASGVALTFTLWPGLAPDPGGVLAASMAVQTVEPRATLGSFLARFHPDQLKRLNADELAPMGFVVYVRVQIQGKKHGRLSLDELNYDWRSKRPLSVESPPSAVGFQPDTPNDQYVAPVWVADPQLSRAFFVRLMLFDGRVMLAFADTPRLQGA